jgi:hypothetical protein
MLQLNGKLTDLDGFDVPANATRLSTNIILPVPATPSSVLSRAGYAGHVVFDGKLVDAAVYADRNKSWVVKAGVGRWKPLSAATDDENEPVSSTTVAVSVGGACVVARVFVADACEGSGPVAVQLRGDAGETGGLLYGAMRLEVQHYRSGQGGTLRGSCSANVRVGVLVAAYSLGERGQTVQASKVLEIARQMSDAEVRSTVSTVAIGNTPIGSTPCTHPDRCRSAEVWSVSAVTPQNATLEAARERRADPLQSVGSHVLYRKINGQNIQLVHLTVNGTAVFPLPQPPAP